MRNGAKVKSNVITVACYFFSVMSRRDITLGKAILVLLTLACLKETLDIASWVFYTVIVEETD